MKHTIILFIAFLMLFSCTKEETLIQYRTLTETIEVEVPGETITVVETVTINNILPPDAYSFTREGVSTVYYTGQSARLEMAQEISSALNNETFTADEIDSMFNLGIGFSNTDLDASGKKIGNKTAAYGSATIKPIFDNWITEVVSDVFPAWNSDATAGVPGQITDAGGGRTARVNGKGLEINQAFTKSLIGAHALDQIVNGYLDKSAKLDAVEADNDADVFHYTSPGSSEENVTKMEHYWDEGFGYLYGLDNQTYPELGKGVLLNKYLSKVDATDERGIAKVIYDAFSLGRAAIVNKDYELRDAQAAIIKSNLSKVIGYKAAYYMRSGADYLTAGTYADAFHALSEGYGFILSLQFTKNENGVPYMTKDEVDTLLNSLMEGNGFWDRTPEELTAIAVQIESATGLISN